jgi:protein TonB
MLVPCPERYNKEIAMYFSHLSDGSAGKVSKIAIVAALHVVVAAALLKNMNSKTISIPKMPDEIVLLFTPEPPKPPPPPPEPPKPMPKVAPPRIIAPPPVVELPPPAVAPPVQAATQTDPAPAPPGPVQPEAPPAVPGNTGAMRTAVLADANGCAKPDYPSRAARNGESGTVVLALLVGTDGRVAGSRVQSSSGSRELDKAAVAALSLCKFKPATTGGVAEQAWGQIAYVWTLDQ